ncbi:MAG: hypothetical protein EKK55_14865 [Rhodocyclaceae bacterium]|nr:MAG: hypothetical protein EKK55_14865 [Rhodocyclaceae bacterium]
MASQRIQDFAQITEVKGLRELNAELKKASPEMAKKLQEVNKQLVQRVADRAKSNFYRTVPGRTRSDDRPRRPGRGSISTSRDSIRASASGQQAKVITGGAKAPAFFGHEFGGGARPRTRQFPVHRGREGYVVYPEVRRARASAEKDWNEIFDEVFPE